MIKDESPVFCSISSRFEMQLDKEKACQNDYECNSNSCIGGECGDLAAEIRETNSILNALFDWLKNIFG